MRRLDDISDTTDMSLSKLQEIVKEREEWNATVQGLQSWAPLSNATTTATQFTNGPSQKLVGSSIYPVFTV